MTHSSQTAASQPQPSLAASACLLHWSGVVTTTAAVNDDGTKKQPLGRALFGTTWCCQSLEGLYFLVPASQRKCVDGVTISRIHTLAPHLGFGLRIYHQERPVATSFPMEKINPAIAAAFLALPLPSDLILPTDYEQQHSPPAARNTPHQLKVTCAIKSPIKTGFFEGFTICLPAVRPRRNGSSRAIQELMALEG